MAYVCIASIDFICSAPASVRDNSNDLLAAVSDAWATTDQRNSPLQQSGEQIDDLIAMYLERARARDAV